MDTKIAACNKCHKKISPMEKIENLGFCKKCLFKKTTKSDYVDGIKNGIFIGIALMIIIYVVMAWLMGLL